MITQNITHLETGIAYHYCDFSDPRTLEGRNILGALIRQLAQDLTISSELEKHMDPLYGPDSRSVTDDMLSDILFRVVGHFSTIYFIIDGLDECGNDVQTMVLSKVHWLARCVKLTANVFVSSRDEDLISMSLKDFPRLQVSTKKIESDIDHFIEETVDEHIRAGKLKTKDSALRDEVVEALKSKADGMFVAP